MVAHGPEGTQHICIGMSLGYLSNINIDVVDMRRVSPAGLIEQFHIEERDRDRERERRVEPSSSMTSLSLSLSLSDLTLWALDANQSS